MRDDTAIRLEHERNLEHYRQKEQWRRDTGAVFLAEGSALFESIISYGQLACKAFMLINGGASVAILAFLGQIFTRSEVTGIKPLTQGLSQSLCLFVIGTTLAALLSGFGYITQRVYFQEFSRRVGIARCNFDKTPEERSPTPSEKGGVLLTTFSTLIGAGSLGCFVWGAWIAKAAFMAAIAQMAS